jgi:catechol 2,3-dioxygenase-like lactoylglutathione lyase family enzyme
MIVSHLDHLVLTVKDIPRTVVFYTTVLGMREVTFGEGRKALEFGVQKINLHRHGREFDPKCYRPTPGSADLCFITSTPVAEVMAHLQKHHVPVVEGPVKRTGASGELLSVYFYDPDGNLVEMANQVGTGNP